MRIKTFTVRLFIRKSILDLLDSNLFKFRKRERNPGNNAPKAMREYLNSYGKNGDN